MGINSIQFIFSKNQLILFRYSTTMTEYGLLLSIHFKEIMWTTLQQHQHQLRKYLFALISIEIHHKPTSSPHWINTQILGNAWFVWFERGLKDGIETTHYPKLMQSCPVPFLFQLCRGSFTRSAKERGKKGGGIGQASGLVCVFLSAKEIEAFQQLNASQKWSLSTRNFLPPPFPITDAEGAAFNEHNHTLCLFRMKTTTITFPRPFSTMGVQQPSL